MKKMTGLKFIVKEVMMKTIWAILIARVLFVVFSKRNKTVVTQKEVYSDVIHPAAYALR